jgi:hypothetical protein
MPTPTPIPSSQIVQAVQASQNIIDNAVQQGIVGVLLLFAIAVVLYMAAQLIKAYFQRNYRPDQGQDSAIKAMAEMTTRSDEREERQQAQRQQEREEWRKQIEARDGKFIEAVSHLGDGYNRMGDVLERQVALQEAMASDRKFDATTINAMKADLGQMVSEGSIPVRSLIPKVDAIKSDTDVILEHVKRIEELLQRQADCIDITERLIAIEKLVKEKLTRDTQTNPVTVNVNPQPAVVIPDTDAGGSAVGEAAA